MSHILARICSLHFNNDAYKRNLKAELLGIPHRKILKDDAVPTENLSSSAKAATASTSDRTINALKTDTGGVMCMEIRNTNGVLGVSY